MFSPKIFALLAMTTMGSSPAAAQRHLSVKGSTNEIDIPRHLSDALDIFIKKEKIKKLEHGTPQGEAMKYITRQGIEALDKELCHVGDVYDQLEVAQLYYGSIIWYHLDSRSSSWRECHVCEKSIHDEDHWRGPYCWQGVVNDPELRVYELDLRDNPTNSRFIDVVFDPETLRRFFDSSGKEKLPSLCLGGGAGDEFIPFLTENICDGVDNVFVDTQEASGASCPIGVSCCENLDDSIPRRTWCTPGWA